MTFADSTNASRNNLPNLEKIGLRQEGGKKYGLSPTMLLPLVGGDDRVPKTPTSSCGERDVVIFVELFKDVLAMSIVVLYSL
jgi:hypothetical protein